MNPRPNDSKSTLLASLSLYSTAGIQLAACILLGLALGDYLDQVWRLTPLLTLLGLILGTGVGFLALVKMLNWQKKRDERRDSQ